MPIDSKECFAALTEDGQLWEIYQAAQSGGGGGGITSINGDTTAAQLISGTAPITASTAAGTTTISTSIATNRIVGRSTAGTGVMEQLTPVGITVSGGNITGIGGTVGTVDSAVPRADGTGGFTVQGSDIVIDDATTSTANNVAIVNNHVGQTNSSLVLMPKGNGALIAGPKPDGTAVGGNARGANAVDLQTSRSAATQVASGISSFAAGATNTASGGQSAAFGSECTASSSWAIACGRANQAKTGSYATAVGGQDNQSQAFHAIVAGGYRNNSSATYSGILGSFYAVADRHAMQSHAGGRFAADGDAQRARFVMRCKTTTNAAVEMTLDGAAPGASNRLTIPAGKYLTGTINIAGIKSDGATAASYIRQFSIKHISATATTSLVGTVNTVGVDEAAGTTISITANDTNDALKVDVTGITSEIWRWVASVDVVEVGYGT